MGRSLVMSTSAIALSLPIQGGQLYRAIDLGTLPGDAASTYAHAFLWTGGIMTDLGTLGGSWSEARAVNDQGQIAGASYGVGDVQFRAFHWDNGAMIDLGFGDAEALGINNAGQIVGQVN